MGNVEVCCGNNDDRIGNPIMNIAERSAKTPRNRVTVKDVVKNQQKEPAMPSISANGYNDYFNDQSFRKEGGEIVKSEELAEKKKVKMMLKWNSRKFKFLMNNDSTILQLREKCFGLSGVPPNRQEFINLNVNHEEKQMIDNKKIEFYNSSKKIIFRMIGSNQEWKNREDIQTSYLSPEQGLNRNLNFNKRDYRNLDSLRYLKPLKGENHKDFANRLVSRLSKFSTTDDLDIIRVVFKWVHHNIKYDYDSVVKEGINRKYQLDPEYIFRLRKGVCVGKSFLFQSMIHHVTDNNNIRCKYLTGHSKSELLSLFIVNKSSKRGISGHAWNIIELEGNRQFVFDVTRDYFLIPKNEISYLFLETDFDGYHGDQEKVIEFLSKPCYYPYYFEKKFQFKNSLSSNIFSSFSVKTDELKLMDMDENKNKKRIERIVFSIPDTRFVRSVSARIKYKNELKWIPEEQQYARERKISRKYEKSIPVKKVSKMFLIHVPIHENPYNKRFGMIQFFCNEEIVWEFCLIHKT